MAAWHPGDPVAFRFIRYGKVRGAMPHVVVRDGAELVALHIPVGARGKRPAWDGRPIRGQADREWELRDHAWHSWRVLRLIRARDWYSLDLFWDAADAFAGWYVNIQEPLRRTPIGFDTDDLVLDLWVEPDGTASWKDEDELAAAVELGRFSPDQARAIRGEGERVLAARPWPTGWEDWQPDPAWPTPTLPHGWGQV